MEINDFNEFDQMEINEVHKPEVGEGKNYEDTIKDINNEYSKRNCSFSDIEEIARITLNSLPKLNRNELRDEIAQMHVQTYENPTTFQLTQALSQVQSYKDRLAEISNMAEHECLIRKRIVDMLFDANQAVSKQSSADKRKGEATLRFPTYLLQLDAANSFKLEVSNISNNIRSIGETISRQASILQMQLTLGEYRKKSPQDFNQSEIEKNDYKSGVEEIEWGKV